MAWTNCTEVKLQHSRKPRVVAARKLFPQTVEMSGGELKNYSNCLRHALLRQPWEHRKYTPEFEDGYTTGENPNIKIYSHPRLHQKRGWS